MGLMVSMSLDGLPDVMKSTTPLSPQETKQVLDDSAQIMINSTQAGFVLRQSPSGNPWAKNPEWYATMKRGAAPLTGPASKKVGGPWASKYEFAQVNAKRMKNSLIKKVDSKKAVIEYDSAAKLRASITQHGGMSEMKLVRKDGGPALVFDIKVRPRPHLGIADKVPRLMKTDTSLIMDLFDAMVDKKLR